MRPITLAVIFDQRISAGGAYQQNLNDALLARDLSCESIQVFFYTTLNSNIASLASCGIDAKPIYLTSLHRAADRFRRKILNSPLYGLIHKFQRFSLFEQKLIKNGVDIVYFLSPTTLASSLENLNYIATVWDLCHRDDPEFPEVRSCRIFETRDQLYRSTLPRATAIFVDSEFGKANLIRRYGLDTDRVHIMPFRAAYSVRMRPNSGISIHKAYNLDCPYVFYPAQFWPHKNHVYLLEGLHRLYLHYGKRIGALFSGADKGNLAHVASYAKQLGLHDVVRFVGLVPNEQIPALYLDSLALVMPSYFGPTNLPPLEAFILGVPVLYSNKAGLRDQVGDAALLMDLNDPDSLANHLNNLIEDKGLRANLIVAGYQRSLQNENFDRRSVLLTVLQDFRSRRSCWQ